MINQNFQKDKMIKEEIEAGCIQLDFTCPKCGRWIGTAIVKKHDYDDDYDVIRSGCSSSYEGIEESCRECREDSEIN